jgi:hypothetical protein
VKIRLKVKPSSAKQKIEVEAGGMPVVFLNSPPADGEANRELVEFLSRLLKISKSSVTIIRGHSSRFKTVELENIDESAARKLLSAP